MGQPDQNSGLKLFAIQHQDCGMYVFALDMIEAINRWRKHLICELELEAEDAQPAACTEIADISEVLLPE